MQLTNLVKITSLFQMRFVTKGVDTMKRMMKKTMAFILTICLVTPIVALADAAPGDVIVTLGENLSEEQEQSLLSEMDASLDDQIVYVSNEEEHEYLGDYIAASKIGTRAL